MQGSILPGADPLGQLLFALGEDSQALPLITLEQNSFQRLCYLQMRGFKLLSQIQCCFLCKLQGKTQKQKSRPQMLILLG